MVKVETEVNSMTVDEDGPELYDAMGFEATDRIKRIIIQSLKLPVLILSRILRSSDPDNSLHR